MLYGKGGVAWEHSQDSIGPVFAWGTSLPNACLALTAGTSCNATGTDTEAGWTVGVGITWAFTDNWSAGIEYDHYGFGNHTVTLTAPAVGGVGPGSAPITVNQNIDAVKVTLDYRFGWFGR